MRQMIMKFPFHEWGGEQKKLEEEMTMKREGGVESRAGLWHFLFNTFLVIMMQILQKNEFIKCLIHLICFPQSYLLNIPGWDWRRDDQAVCLNEVKFGMLAQSCLAPGFFTMASNIISASLLNIMPEMPKWGLMLNIERSRTIFADGRKSIYQHPTKSFWPKLSPQHLSASPSRK